jgi:hypothetical protein
MPIELDKQVTVKVQAKEIRLHMKVRDEFEGDLVDQNGKVLAGYEGYVPGFFPEDHYGDYLILNIDLETGQITNWKAPTAKEIQDTFFKKDRDDD